MGHQRLDSLIEFVFQAWQLLDLVSYHHTYSVSAQCHPSVGDSYNAELQTHIQDVTCLIYAHPVIALMYNPGGMKAQISPVPQSSLIGCRLWHQT